MAFASGMEPLFSSETLLWDETINLEADDTQHSFSDMDDSSFEPSTFSYSSEEAVEEEPQPSTLDQTTATIQYHFDMIPDPMYPPKCKGERIELIAGPAEHQVKDYLVIPTNVLSLKAAPKEGDYIVVKLVCEQVVCSEREIFLTAASAKYSTNTNGDIEIPNLKITHIMTPGKTKGYKFAFTYTLYSEGEQVEKLVSTPFHLWSNVSQKGFPRSIRDRYLIQRTKANANKRRRLN